MAKRFLVVLLVVVIPSLSFAPKLIKIGYIDLDKLFEKYAAVSDIIKSLKEERKQIEQEIERRKEEIKKLEEEFIQQKDVLSDTERQRREAEIEYRKEELNKFVEEKNRELEKKKKELTKPFLKEIYKAVREVCREEGVSIVFRRSKDILFVDDDLDLTPKVLKKLKRWEELRKRY